MKQLAILVAVALLLLFLGLGDAPLQDSTEPRVTGIVAEMAVTGDYLVPHLNGVPFLEKPPLHAWLGALAFNAFGFGRAPLRAVSELAGVAYLTCKSCWLDRAFPARQLVRIVPAFVCALAHDPAGQIASGGSRIAWWLQGAVVTLLASAVVALGLCAYGGALWRQYTDERSLESLYRELQRQPGCCAHVALFRPTERMSGAAHYALHRVVPEVHTRAELTEFLGAGPPALVVALDEEALLAGSKAGEMEIGKNRYYIVARRSAP